MIHAFLIIAHNNFEILEKQIEILKNKNSDFYIHVDKRAFFDEYKFLKKFPDASIHFIERKKVFGGGSESD